MPNVCGQAVLSGPWQEILDQRNHLRGKGSDVWQTHAMTGKFVTKRAAKSQQEEDHQGPLVAKPKVQEAGAKDPIVDMPPGWNSLVLDVLQEGSQQLLFALVMPSIEPHRTIAGLFEVATEQRHDRAFAFTPFAFDRDRDGRLGLGIAD